MVKFSTFSTFYDKVNHEANFVAVNQNIPNFVTHPKMNSSHGTNFGYGWNRIHRFTYSC